MAARVVRRRRIQRHRAPRCAPITYMGAAVVPPGRHHHGFANVEPVAGGIVDKVGGMGWPFFRAPDVPRHDIGDADNGRQHHLCTRAQSQVRSHGCGNGARGEYQQVQRARQQFGSREHGCDNPPQRSGAHLRFPPVRLSHGSKGMMACGAFATCQNHGQVWHNG